MIDNFVSTLVKKNHLPSQAGRAFAAIAKSQPATSIRISSDGNKLRILDAKRRELQITGQGRDGIMMTRVDRNADKSRTKTIDTIVKQRRGSYLEDRYGPGWLYTAKEQVAQPSRTFGKEKKLKAFWMYGKDPPNAPQGSLSLGTGVPLNPY